MKSQIVIVDKNDEILGYKERSALTSDDMYRITALWLTNAEGDILLAQRKLTKNNNPGTWGPAVAGTVEEGETYKVSMIKEIREELGLTDLKLERGPKRFKDEGARRFFCQWFMSDTTLKVTDFKLQAEEVEQVKWFTPEELKATVAARPEQFVPLFGEDVAMLVG